LRCHGPGIVRRSVIETHSWIAFFHKHPKGGPRLFGALNQGHEVCDIPPVYSAFLRGLRYTNNLQLVQDVTEFWRTLPSYAGIKARWDAATRLWGMTKRQPTLPGENAIVMAAFVLPLDATLGTSTVQDFQVVSLPIENWRDD
jgi:hypothetical protein